jgi:hypothetical protein
MRCYQIKTSFTDLFLLKNYLGLKPLCKILKGNYKICKVTSKETKHYGRVRFSSWRPKKITTSVTWSNPNVSSNLLSSNSKSVAVKIKNAKKLTSKPSLKYLKPNTRLRSRKWLKVSSLNKVKWKRGLKLWRRSCCKLMKNFNSIQSLAMMKLDSLRRSWSNQNKKKRDCKQSWMTFRPRTIKSLKIWCNRCKETKICLKLS